jgi:hypothetical protein
MQKRNERKLRERTLRSKLGELRRFVADTKPDLNAERMQTYRTFGVTGVDGGNITMVCPDCHRSRGFLFGSIVWVCWECGAVTETKFRGCA